MTHTHINKKNQKQKSKSKIKHLIFYKKQRQRITK